MAKTPHILEGVFERIADGAKSKALIVGAKDAPKESPKFLKNLKDIMERGGPLAKEISTNILLGGGLGAVGGSLFPLSTSDYVDKYDREAIDPAWKSALLGAIASPVLSTKTPAMLALSALSGGALGGALGYGYGLTRENEKTKRAAAKLLDKKFEDPLNG